MILVEMEHRPQYHQRGGAGGGHQQGRSSPSEHLHGGIKEEPPRVSGERGSCRDSGAGGVHSEKHRRKSKR